ncbi:hypothetical protein FGG08_001788 [Glutinoglossum americanum]|uniref:Uncharacterized protein n=1 Tax=Glutinoglossum americanum TaxID=1670608 RepID=A0A9P8I603_9PEZI|nr:hypothetical protein FGG08_001788 [Glutinoglossum americanum]
MAALESNSRELNSISDLAVGRLARLKIRTFYELEKLNNKLRPIAVVSRIDGRSPYAPKALKWSRQKQEKGVSFGMAWHLIGPQQGELECGEFSRQSSRPDGDPSPKTLGVCHLSLADSQPQHANLTSAWTFRVGCKRAPYASAESLRFEAWLWLKNFCNVTLIGSSLPALHVASRFRCEDIVEYLLKVCAVGVRDGEGYTAMHHAAEKGHFEVVKLLLDAGGVKVDRLSNLKCTLLWLAASNGHRQIVSLLIERGAMLKPRTDSAIVCRRDEAVVRLLVEKGADLESRTSSGQTPLSSAVEEGHETVVKLLLEKGADPESKTNSGQTPLLLAAEKGHKTAVKLLVEKGAVNSEPRTSSGQTPLLLAAGKGHEVIVELLVKGADLESKSSSGRTPLPRAAGHGDESVVELLAEKGTDLESTDVYGEALSWAARNGNESAAKLLRLKMQST